jgi:hypothetical protein
MVSPDLASRVVAAVADDGSGGAVVGGTGVVTRGDEAAAEVAGGTDDAAELPKGANIWLSWLRSNVKAGGDDVEEVDDDI